MYLAEERFMSSLGEEKDNEERGPENVVVVVVVRDEPRSAIWFGKSSRSGASTSVARRLVFQRNFAYQESPARLQHRKEKNNEQPSFPRVDLSP